MKSFLICGDYRFNTILFAQLVPRYLIGWKIADAWEKRKLGEVVSRIKSYPLSRDVERNSPTGFRYVHYGDIHTRKVDLITSEEALPCIKPGNYEHLQEGDIVFADASEDYEDIAAPAVLLTESHEVIVSGLHTIAIRPDDKLRSIFLYYMTKAPSFRKYVRKEGQGLKVFGISASKILRYKAALPQVSEQFQVSSLLRQLDQTIALHHQRYFAG
jgi:type I restriction enzyme S subunit